MRSREAFNELTIRFGEVIREKIACIHPSKLCNFERAWLAFNDCADEEMKID
jgi:hypothetical protein